MFLYLILYKKNSTPIVTPTLPPRIMIWTHFNLNILRMIPHKLKIFSAISFEKKILKEFYLYIFLKHPHTHTTYCGYLRILPHKLQMFWSTGFWEEGFHESMIWTNYLPTLPEDDSTQVIYSLSDLMVFEIFEKYEQIFHNSNILNHLPVKDGIAL